MVQSTQCWLRGFMPLTFYSVYANTSNDNDIVFHHSSRLTASVVLLKLNLKFYFTKTSEAEKPFRSVFFKLVCPRGNRINLLFESPNTSWNFWSPGEDLGQFLTSGIVNNFFHPRKKCCPY